ncbi:MAG TPA: hypothetical protein VFG45_02095 [Candidatus Nitrosocosmicus sp.]|nr:hypothetical protein [Candidatus Nitrosocosmicus sp.]
MSNPLYYKDTNTLIYDTQTDNATSIDLPEEFGQIVLINLEYIVVIDKIHITLDAF